MKIVKEPTGSIIIYPFLSEDAPEQAERGAFYIAVFPDEVKLMGMLPLPISAARDLAKAIYKAAEIAEKLRYRENDENDYLYAGR